MRLNRNSRFVLFAIGALAAGIGVSAATAARADSGGSNNNDNLKVYVCKYVGTPGDGERLQTGNNPIDVSVNSIRDYTGVGSFFADGQGRSFVLAEDHGQGTPDISQCPAPQSGGNSTTPSGTPLSSASATPSDTPSTGSPSGGTSSTDAPTSAAPTLVVSKVADKATVAAGESVNFTVCVKNTGATQAAGVVLSDLVPAEFEIVSAPGGTISGQNVSFAVGTLNADSVNRCDVVTAKARTLTTTDNSGNDQLTVSKYEAQISLPANQTQTFSGQCADGGVAADAAVRIDAVDQGTGDFGSVEVRSVTPTSDGRGYSALVVNHASGQAQGKLEILCLPAATTEARPLLFSDTYSQTKAFGSGLHSITFACGAGRTLVAPGYVLQSGSAYLAASVPLTSAVRRLDFNVSSGTATIAASVRCLSNTTGAVAGGTTQLVWTPIHKTVTVAGNSITTEQLTCGDLQKGIVAGWELNSQLRLVGHEPQPKTRVFKFWNPTSGSLSGTIYLLCLDIRTGSSIANPDVVNTVTASSTTAIDDASVLSDDAVVHLGDSTAQSVSPALMLTSASLIHSSKGWTLAVGVPTSAPAGKVVLRSTSVIKVGHKTYRKGAVLGSAKFTKKGTVSVKLSPSVAQKLHGKTVKITITTRGHSVSRTFKLR
jgi:uncharacterized repeat protein (TIGR01451 family)